jgi:hypothetical protein
MKMSLKTLSALVLVVLGGDQALGCATCFGQSDSEMAKGMNAGIFVLLGFVALFWAAFGSFFVFIVRRSQSTGDVLPGDQNDPQHN